MNQSKEDFEGGEESEEEEEPRSLDH